MIAESKLIERTPRTVSVEECRQILVAIRRGAVATHIARSIIFVMPRK